MENEKEKTSDLKAGLLQIYITPQGKTNFIPYGLALRASGYGFRSLVTRFVHHDFEAGEAPAAELLAPNLVIDASALKGGAKGAGMDKPAVRAAFQNGVNAALSGAYDLVILEGVLDMVSRGFISLDDLLKLINEKKIHVELLLTGSHSSDALNEKAHLITQMTEMKEAQSAPGGTVEVVTGRGKGKTTYCLGKALLMSSMGMPCFMLQVIKSPRLYGEIVASQNLPNMQIQSMGKGLVGKRNPDVRTDHKKAAREAWRRSKEIVMSRRYGLVVLDEINIALNYGFIDPQEVLELIGEMPETLHLMLGGRYAHPEIVDAAKWAFEMKEIKHPYKAGIKARKGIEY